MQTRKINIELLELLAMLSDSAKAYYFELYLKANAGGLIANDGSLHLYELLNANLIQATNEMICINHFSTYNYGKLKQDYNPHSKAWRAINEAGLAYNSESKMIELPLNDRLETQSIKKDSILNIESSSTSALSSRFAVVGDQDTEKPLKSKLETSNKIVEVLSLPSFALILVALLLMTQSICSSKAILNLTSLEYPLNYIYSISGAILIDSLLLYFVARSERFITFVSFVFCSLLNVFSFHLNELLDYNTFASYMAIGVSVMIPLMIHSVSTQLSRQGK